MRVRLPSTNCSALVVAAAVAVTAGCGGSGALSAQQYPAAAEQLVTEVDLGHFDPRSPSYVLMDWWRGAQFSDVDAYLHDLTRHARNELDRSELERRLPILAGGIRTAKPRILSLEVDGNNATLYTKIVFRQPVGATRYVTTTRPQAFRLERVRGTWRLADTFFADSVTAAALGAARRG